jgi:AcrR family transcriptional regulator
MPKVYSDEKRIEIKERLMIVGVELIKVYGMKRMSIEEITKKVGIAQGTFYNFFKSKEIFVCEIARAYQQKLNDHINELVETKGSLSRGDVRAFYRATFLEDENSIYRYLSREDIQTIITRVPASYVNDISKGRDAIARVFEKVENKKEICDIDLIYNWIQLLNLAVENKDLLSEVAFEKTIDKILDNLLNEIFE